MVVSELTAETMTTFQRRLQLPARTFLLLGPRATGKTTWLRSHLPDARWYNLVLDRELVRLMRDPGAFRQEVDALPPGSWVVVDEVQRLPALLGDVHDMLSRDPGRISFALTGSSARKLRRRDVDLLAGRALTREFFPLSATEMAAIPPADDLLAYGGLPLVRAEHEPRTRTDLLEAYVDTYLGQEIRAEALVRSLDGFTRFLEVAALANGQVTNVAGLARDAGVARPTVQGWFEVLADTLVATWLPAWRPRAKVKEVAHPKFYFFDTGVVRAASGRLREPVDRAERGALLETWVLHELRAFLSIARTGGTLAYWRTPAGCEVDFVWTRGDRRVGVEVKASPRWKSEFGRGLRELDHEIGLDRLFGVYLGPEARRDGRIDVLPLADFLRALWAGEVTG